MAHVYQALNSAVAVVARSSGGDAGAVPAAPAPAVGAALPELDEAEVRGST
jgi:hypothetical protein